MIILFLTVLRYRYQVTGTLRTYAGVAYSAITVTTVFLIRVGIFVKYR